MASVAPSPSLAWPLCLLHFAAAVQKPNLRRTTRPGDSASSSWSGRPATALHLLPRGDTCVCVTMNQGTLDASAALDTTCSFLVKARTVNFLVLARSKDWFGRDFITTQTTLHSCAIMTRVLIFFFSRPARLAQVPYQASPTVPIESLAREISYEEMVVLITSQHVRKDPTRAGLVLIKAI